MSLSLFSYSCWQYVAVILERRNFVEQLIQQKGWSEKCLKNNILLVEFKGLIYIPNNPHLIYLLKICNKVCTYVKKNDISKVMAFRMSFIKSSWSLLWTIQTLGYNMYAILAHKKFLSNHQTCLPSELQENEIWRWIWGTWRCGKKLEILKFCQM